MPGAHTAQGCECQGGARTPPITVAIGRKELPCKSAEYAEFIRRVYVREVASGTWCARPARRISPGICRSLMMRSKPGSGSRSAIAAKVVRSDLVVASLGSSRDKEENGDRRSQQRSKVGPSPQHE